MQWLRENAFLAEWLALPVSLFAAYAQNRGKSPKEVQWEWVMIYLTFGIAFPVSLSRNFDEFAREFAKWLAMFSFIAIVFNRRRDN
jgi:hypothetical protein